MDDKQLAGRYRKNKTESRAVNPLGDIDNCLGHHLLRLIHFYEKVQ